MKILILGGTIFLGRHIVDAALARGHEVTLFNRGKNNPDLYPQLEKVRGDREKDLEQVADRKFDAVVDTCGYVPRVVKQSAEFFADRCRHYTFVSTISVFSDLTKGGIDEDHPVGTLDEPTEEITGETYGPLKALCESAAEDAMPGRVFNVRPGLIVGPWDPTNRFTYWPARFDRGGEVLIPDVPDEPIQVIDARDLAEWTVHALENDITGVYNATGPTEPFPWRDLLRECTSAAQPKDPVRPVPVSEDFLREKEVGPWMELPLWIPAEPDSYGFSRINVQKAVSAGLRFRSLGDTVADTLAWYREQPERDWPAGMAADKETQLLEEWKSR